MADCNREHEYRLDKADERLDKLTDCLNGVTLKTEKIDEATKSAHKRIDEIGEIPHAVLRISLAVENMTEEVKELALTMKGHQKEMNERIEKLEKAPGENAYQLQRQIIITIVLGIVGFALGKWGIKWKINYWDY